MSILQQQAQWFSYFSGQQIYIKFMLSSSSETPAIHAVLLGTIRKVFISIIGMITIITHKTALGIR